MGLRSWMEGMKVSVVLVDPLPEYELEALKELAKKLLCEFSKKRSIPKSAS